MDQNLTATQIKAIQSLYRLRKENGWNNYYSPKVIGVSTATLNALDRKGWIKANPSASSMTLDYPSVRLHCHRVARAVRLGYIVR